MGLPRRIAVVSFTCAAFIAALWLADHVLGRYRWADVAAQLAAIPGRALFAALLLTAGSYGALVLYDVIALRYAGAAPGWKKTVIASFSAYAVGNSLGFSALSGGSIRLRVYSSAGLAARQVAAVILFCSLTFFLGATLLLGLSLALNSARAGAVLHLPQPLVIAAGGLATALVAGYLAANYWRRAPLRIAGASVRVPGPRLALAQIAVATLDLCLAAGVLYVLLPPGAVEGFTAFLGLYLLALAAGLVSTVPGGLGVFETVLILLLPGVPAHLLLASLLAYRAVYYLLPFATAILVMAAHELWLRRLVVGRALAWLGAWTRAVAPQVLAAAVFACGLVLLFSGATPTLDDRLHILRRFVPLPLLEISHLLGSAAGVALLLLARGLQRRVDAAWHVTVLLLVAGIFASLIKGFDYEEALLLAAILAALLMARQRFHRRASLLGTPFSAPWVVAIALAIAATAGLAYFSYRNLEYSHELWWQFAFRADTPRVMRASVLAIVLSGAAAAWKLLRPAPADLPLPDAAAIDRARRVIAHSDETSAHLALLGDKKLMFSKDDSAFVMFQPVGGSWVAMGDPVGPPAARAELVWAFREACDRFAVRPVFYQVSADNLPAYLDAGLSLSKLGEEARVDLETFDLTGRKRAALRQAHRRAQREGAEFSVLPAAEVPAHIAELRAVSDRWLETKSIAEKGFSLGRFDPGYLRNFDCATVRVAGRVVAFANLWLTGSRAELSVDLMRHGGETAHGLMDYLLIEIMLWGKQAGFRWFNLGMAPLSGLSDRQFAPMWNRTGDFLYRHGEHFYNFEGLRQYKEKFDPQWRPRYLASPGGWALPRVTLDITSLIAGGPRKVLMR